MNKTSIEWAKNPDGTLGWTWNPITGCLNHVNGICRGGNFPCYAYKLAHGRLRTKYLDNYYTLRDREHPTRHTHNDPFFPRYWSNRMDDEDLWNKKPRGIFVCDMGELFGSWVPETYTKAILLTIKANPQHRFYLLTKQPQNLIKFSPFPDNCWVGVTISDGDDDRTPLAYMKRVEAKVKYISFEPLLNWWDVATSDMVAKSLKIAGINWLIIGAQTKPYKPPKIEWVQEIVQAADKAGIPVFLKDNLKPLLKNNQGWTPAWAVSVRECDGTEYLRQEMPKDNKLQNELLDLSGQQELTSKEVERLYELQGDC